MFRAKPTLKKKREKKGMEGRRSHGRGASCGRGARQAQEPRKERETVVEQDCGPRVEAGD